MDVSRGAPRPATKHSVQYCIAADVDAIMQGLQLRRVRRYSWQRFWEFESLLSEISSFVGARRDLENVAEHSWHVADIVLLLGGRFPSVDAFRACAMATLHDKMEIYIGDMSPIARDGTATGTHFGDRAIRDAKKRAESDAVDAYLGALAAPSRDLAADLFAELAEGLTADARFVKAVDKVQALAYVVEAKKRRMPSKHFAFTVAYSDQALSYFPPLAPYVAELQGRLKQ